MRCQSFSLTLKTFYNRENMENVSLVTDLCLVNEMRGRLGAYVNRQFPANWPTYLSHDNVSQLESQRYIIILKPNGWRYLLYVDADGRVFFENRLQHFFLMDPGHAVKLMSLDGRVLTDTVLDGSLVWERHGGRLTFVIQDAIRVDGVDLTGLGIVERIAYVDVIYTYLVSLAQFLLQLFF